MKNYIKYLSITLILTFKGSLFAEDFNSASLRDYLDSVEINEISDYDKLASGIEKYPLVDILDFVYHSIDPTARNFQNEGAKVAFKALFPYLQRIPLSEFAAAYETFVKDKPLEGSIPAIGFIFTIVKQAYFNRVYKMGGKDINMESIVSNYPVFVVDFMKFELSLFQDMMKRPDNLKITSDHQLQSLINVKLPYYEAIYLRDYKLSRSAESVPDLENITLENTPEKVISRYYELEEAVSTFWNSLE